MTLLIRFSTPFTSTKFTAEPRILLGIARIHDMLNDPDKAIAFYKKVLILDATNVESIACLGAHFFYADQVVILSDAMHLNEYYSRS